MKTRFLLMLLFVATFIGCNDNDNDVIFMPEEVVYDLASVSNSAISGTAIFTMNEDNSTTVSITLSGTSSGSHPSHIHFNSAAEGGGIAVSLNPVDGATGMSMTKVSQLEDGTPITYDELTMFNGYINVHESMDNLQTLIAQGDIGSNDLTGDMKTYPLNSVDFPNISGEAIFNKRVNGSTLVTIQLNGTTSGTHPSHIHFNTAAEGGGIAVGLNPVDGTTGISKTSVTMLEDQTAVSYEDLIDFDGYINVHESMNNLATLLAQGDIGQNALTGASKTYDLNEVMGSNVSGDATFFERTNGETLVIVDLNGTTQGASHPAHIHFNTAAEGGGIAVSLTPVDGTTGMSKTSVSMLADQTSISYSELINFDGYINVHESMSNLATLVVQGDIGQNALTGNSTTYNLNQVMGSNVSGDAIFYERQNGEALLVITLSGTSQGASHPSHIHMGSVANPGGIAVMLTPVDGASGISKTNISKNTDDTDFGYADAIGFNGYINVHLSDADLATIVAQGDIGSNI